MHSGAHRIPGVSAQQQLDAWRLRGIQIDTIQCDVSDSVATEQAISGVIANSAQPLRGIVHLAGTLHDGMLAGLSVEEFSGTSCYPR